MAFHYTTDLVPGGWVGVDVFFVLSGFLITQLLLRERHETGRVSVRRFYVRRTVRLLPPLLIALGLAGVLARVPDVDSADGTGVGALAALTYTTDLVRMAGAETGLLAHTWSLAIEEKFYLFWPLTLGVLARRRRLAAGTCAAVVACTGLTALLLLAGVGPETLYLSPVTHVAELLVGALLAIALAASVLPRWLTAGGWLGAPVLLVSAFTLRYTSTHLYLGGWLLLATSTGCVVAHVAGTPGGIATQLLSWGPLVWIGRRSYGLYLYSFPVSMIVLDSGLRVSVGVSAVLLVSMSLAAASFKLVEQPLLRRFT